MENLLLVSALFLAVIFIVAGIGKLLDIKGAQKAAEDFGVPHSPAQIIGLVLPFAEILLGVLLIPLATRWFAAIGVTALLTAFVGGIAYQMAKGNAPDCHCFGQIHSEPVGWSTLIRNGFLLAIGAFLVIFGRETGGASAVAWLFDLNTTEKLVLIFGILLTVLLANAVWFLRQIMIGQNRLARQIELLEYISKAENTEEIEHQEFVPPQEGLPIGAIVPQFDLPSISGNGDSLATALKRKQKGSLLFFVSPSCSQCQVILPEIEEYEKNHGDKFNFIFISSGTAKENEAKFGKNGNSTIFLQKTDEVMTAFRAKWTPTAVFVNANGKIGSKLAVGDVQIRELVQSVSKVETKLNGNSHLPLQDAKLKIGDAAPDFLLPALDGKTYSLKDFHGQNTLFLYWAVGCGFCQKMLPDLLNREAQDTHYRLVVLSLSPPETVGKQGFKSTVLLEGETKTADLYDFGGTPSAYLIDKEGKIASELAVGADDIFALVGYFSKIK